MWKKIANVETYELTKLAITLDRQGSDRYAKVSYPIRYGRLAEMNTPDHLFQFNLNGEIKYISGYKASRRHLTKSPTLTDGRYDLYV